VLSVFLFFFSSRRRHTRSKRDWSSDVCSSDLPEPLLPALARLGVLAPEPEEVVLGHPLPVAEVEASRALDEGDRAGDERFFRSRSEERRVGKEGRSRGGSGHGRNKRAE